MRLQTKLTIATTSVIAVVGAAIGVVGVATIERTALQSIDQTLDTAVLTIENNPDKLEAALLASSIAGDSLQVALLDSAGTLTTLSINDTTIEKLPNSQLLSAAESKPVDVAGAGNPGYRLMVVPINEADYKQILLAVSLRDVASGRDSTFTLTAELTLLAILIGGLANVLIVRRQTRKIARLTAEAKRIADGDLEHELVAEAGSSEIDQLSKSLQNMVESLKQAVRVEQAAQERMQEFLGDASHELRTPLTVIRGYVELLEQAKDAPAEQRERAFERIHAEIKRMETLIRDLLQIAELSEATATMVQLEEVDLSEVVQTSVDDLRALSPARQITVSVEPGLRVSGREDLLRQLLANLLGNIARHTGTSDAVRVTLAGMPDGLVKLTVEDAGPGLPESAYTGELDAFKRFDPSRSRENGGSGLGMSIIAGIVRSHLGSLKLSKSELGGLRTEITLQRVG